MSGLNDEYELERSRLLKDSNTPDPDLLSADKEGVTLVTTYGQTLVPTLPENVPSIKDLFGDNVVPNELPKLQADIVLISQKENNISDVKEATEHLFSTNVICQEDVSFIDVFLPGFVSENNPLAYYTKSPSKTQYQQAVTKLESDIKTKETELIEFINSVYANLLSVVKAVSLYNDKNFILTVNSEKGEIANRIESNKKILEVVSTDERLIALKKMLTCSITTLMTSEDSKLQETIEKLDINLTVTNIVMFLTVNKYIITLRNLKDFLSSTCTISLEQDKVCLMDTLDFLSSAKQDGLFTVIKMLLDEITQAIGTHESVESKKQYLEETTVCLNKLVIFIKSYLIVKQNIINLNDVIVKQINIVC